MDINGAVGQQIATQKDKAKLELQKKLQAKFGDKVIPKKKPKVDEAEISDKAKKKVAIGADEFGDIKSNNPTSEETREKLKGLLKTGAFNFSEKERAALKDILK